jgi:hypothetical protein
MDISAKQAAKATAYWRETAPFASIHLRGMIVRMRKQYYAEIERD